MKNCGSHNVSKHREIKGSDKYITLDVSLKFCSLDKMRIIYSEPEYNLGISGKGLITSLGLKAKAMPHNYKKGRYSIRNVSMENFSKIIRDFEKLPTKIYETSRPRHEPTDSTFT